jgi:hypothetical protein
VLGLCVRQLFPYKSAEIHCIVFCLYGLDLSRNLTSSAHATPRVDPCHNQGINHNALALWLIQQVAQL